jgi:hypothetical protein
MGRWIMKSEEFINEARGEDHGPNSKAALGTDKRFGAGHKIQAWLETPLPTTHYVIQGYDITFTPTALVIKHNGEVLWTKQGDYSSPKNKNLQGAKKLVQGLLRKEYSDDEAGRPLFGTNSELGISSRKELRRS